MVDPEDHRAGQLGAEDLVEATGGGAPSPNGFSIATALPGGRRGRASARSAGSNSEGRSAR